MRFSAPAVVAASSWVLFCVRWFDVAARWRPRALEAFSPWLFAGVATVALAAWLARNGREIFVLPAGASRRDLGLVVALAIAFRFPLAWTAAVGYTTPDGSLSGIVAWRLREGLERLVFVPSVPYSGSLKSHLAAGLSTFLDLSRAFTLSSVLFYAAFVAAVYMLAATLDGAPSGRASRARLAALYVAFAPAFVTRYSLSNDGNYVEVLALGTFALWLSVRAAAADDRRRGTFAWMAGVALGLAFWSHILAILHAAAVGIAFVAGAPRRAVGTLTRLGFGFALGYLPGVLWNAANGWESLLYVLPGEKSVGTLESGPSLPARVATMAFDQWPVLMGYDPGYSPEVDDVFRVLGWTAVLVAAVAMAVSVARLRPRPDFTRTLLLGFVALNLVVAAVALPSIEGNPRYLIFLVTPLSILLADVYGSGRLRAIFGVLVLFGVASSWAQWPGAARADARWRGFVADLRHAGVTHCYTDFFLAAKIDMISEERVACASDLGPTTTEYFRDYPIRVRAAPRAALIAVNGTAAEKLERRLERRGLAYERLDLMKPVLIPERNVHPSELGPSAR